jgi:hypothetical protein
MLGEQEMSGSRRTTYVWAAAVLLVFVSVNIWIARDHLRTETQTNEEAESSLDATILLAQQRAVLFAARPDDGPIDLEMMRKAGVRVPESFVREDHFESPWGPSAIRKAGEWLVWDFYEMTTSGCTQLLEGPIPGVARAASSGFAADEKPAPVTHDVAITECRRTPLIARLILK